MVLKDIKNFIYLECITDWFGVSYTFKQMMNGKKIDPITSSQNFKHYLNVLNKKIFGNSFKRFGKRIEVIPVVETSMSGRLHYHCSIRNPYPDDPERFENLLIEEWRKTNWGYHEIFVDRTIDNGWIDYSVKTGFENIDWVNFHKV